MKGAVYAVLILAMFARSEAAWCVCRSDLQDAQLQPAIDYACGKGADCTPILQSGPCYNPNTVKAHCNYAVNSYFQKSGQNSMACNFAGAAVTTNTDPSYTGCSFPASSSSSTPTNGNTNTYSPPNTVFGGLAPSGNVMTDSNEAPTIPPPAILAILSFPLLLLIRP
ncbi:hypothetical protein LUZ60_010124 [Juncus effusus]|nr:hypothetical protein LUZ60_010124 [Juncus effusus]